MVGNKFINDFIVKIRKGKINACEDMKKTCDLVENVFKNEKVYINKEQLNAYISIGNAMFDFLLPWETFLVTLILCTYKEDGKPRFNMCLIMIGRGAGKDGFIAWLSLCMISSNNPIPYYDVDICANNEDQAMRPIKDDIMNFFAKSEYSNINKKSFYWTMEKVRGKRNRGYIKGHTNNAKGKDGLRSGAVILNEIHQYEGFENVDVFTTGLGKKGHPRSIYITTNGNVRGGVLDHYLDMSKSILNREVEDGGFLPFLCHLDSDEEIHDEKNWYKANPSLMYFPDLLEQYRKEYNIWKNDPQSLPAFPRKRMNQPGQVSDQAVCDYKYIKATNKPLIDLRGKHCIVGVDFTKTTDFCSASVVFKVGNNRYVMNHTWICMKSKDLHRIKIKDEFSVWQDKGIVTLIYEDEISPTLISDYIQKLKANYVIDMVAIDDFRFPILSNELKQIGVSKENKNLKLVRPSDISKTVSIVERCFINGFYFWGDNPMLRWATNNTKVVLWKPNTINKNDIGNSIYAKIEGKSRKTDPFMSMVHAQTCENSLVEIKPLTFGLRAKAF